MPDDDLPIFNLSDPEQKLRLITHVNTLRVRASGTLNCSEFFRLLLHREFSRRRTGKSVVKDREISSEWRVGHPKKQLPFAVGHATLSPL